MASIKPPPPDDFDENPEWTAETERRSRPASEVHPPHVVAALVRNRGGRPRGSTKEQVSLRIDRDILARFRAGGPGWQSRINEALRKAAG